MLGQDLLGRRTAAWVMLAAHDVVGAGNLVAADAQAVTRVAIVPPDNRVGPAEQGDVGKRPADEVVPVRIVPCPSPGVV